MTIDERTQRLMAAILVKATDFIIYDVPYMNTVDNYIFDGFQETKYGGLALYSGFHHGYTICLSTIKELKK